MANEWFDIRARRAIGQRHTKAARPPDSEKGHTRIPQGNPEPFPKTLLAAVDDFEDAKSPEFNKTQ